MVKEKEIMKIWTVGHSTKGVGEFIELLAGYDIKALADVRRYPASRKHPHFNQGRLSASLDSADIEYLPLPELGGRRRPLPDSHNTAWRSESFRGYADYMESDSFRSGIERLLESAQNKRTA